MRELGWYLGLILEQKRSQMALKQERKADPVLPLREPPSPEPFGGLHASLGEPSQQLASVREEVPDSPWGRQGADTTIPWALQRSLWSWMETQYLGHLPSGTESAFEGDLLMVPEHTEVREVLG